MSAFPFFWYRSTKRDLKSVSVYSNSCQSTAESKWLSKIFLDFLNPTSRKMAPANASYILPAKFLEFTSFPFT
ncbi:MAG: hypothetical protein RBR62_08300 [Bacteroidales bacterium]|nr:hypothetical protein [Bacteroidales bacterium]